MSNRWELRTLLRTEIKIDPNGKIWDDTALNNYIDIAYLQVQKDWNFKWRENDAETTISIVSGTQEYDLPTDLGKVELIRVRQTQLWKTTLIDLKKRISNFASGIPSEYYVRWAKIGFDVIPNITESAEFFYKKRLAKFTSDTSESEFWEDFDVAIVKYAAFLAWSSPRGNEGTASRKLEEYRLELDTLVSTYIFDDINDLTFGIQRNVSRNTWARVLDR